MRLPKTQLCPLPFLMSSLLAEKWFYTCKRLWQQRKDPKPWRLLPLMMVKPLMKNAQEKASFCIKSVIFWPICQSNLPRELPNIAANLANKLSKGGPEQQEPSATQFLAKKPKRTSLCFVTTTGRKLTIRAQLTRLESTR